MRSRRPDLPSAPGFRLDEIVVKNGPNSALVAASGVKCLAIWRSTWLRQIRYVQIWASHSSCESSKLATGESGRAWHCRQHAAEGATAGRCGVRGGWFWRRGCNAAAERGAWGCRDATRRCDRAARYICFRGWLWRRATEIACVGTCSFSRRGGSLATRIAGVATPIAHDNPAIAGFDAVVFLAVPTKCSADPLAIFFDLGRAVVQDPRWCC
jgi:hypothetical protein